MIMPKRPHLIGTYTAPAVRIGERVDCLFRDCLCEVTSISDAPIPWPRVQPRNQRGGWGRTIFCKNNPKHAVMPGARLGRQRRVPARVRDLLRRRQSRPASSIKVTRCK